MSTPFDPDARAASDPAASPEELSRIAQSRPDLLSAVYANPAAYPALRQWIETYFPDAVHGTRREAPSAFPAATEQNLAPAALASASGAESRGVRGGSWAWMILGGAIGMTVVVAAVLLFQGHVLGSPRGGDTVAAVATPSAQPVATATTASASPTPTPTHTYTPTTAPAATSTPTATHEDYLLVDSASMNFSCEIHPDWVGCSIAKRYYGENGQVDCDQDLFSISSEAGPAEVVCGQQFLGTKGDHVTHLVSGQTVTNGDFSCTLDGTGDTESVECERTSTGQYLWFDRNSYSISW